VSDANCPIVIVENPGVLNVGVEAHNKIGAIIEGLECLTVVVENPNQINVVIEGKTDQDDIFVLVSEQGPRGPVGPAMDSLPQDPDPYSVIESHPDGVRWTKHIRPRAVLHAEHNLGSIAGARDLSVENGSRQRGLVTDNCTLSLVKPEDACHIHLRLKNVGAGHSIQWTAVDSPLRWLHGDIILSPVDGAEHIIVLVYGHSGWVGDGVSI
jgi:hypothetical protein